MCPVRGETFVQISSKTFYQRSNELRLLFDYSVNEIKSDDHLSFCPVHRAN